MEYNKILKNLEGREMATIIHKNGNESNIFRHNKLWQVKNFMGNLFYNDEEMAKEIEEEWEADFIL